MLLVIHAALTWILVGLILTIQLVHYPLFSRVGTSRYVAYQREHVKRVTWLVVPLMLAEFATGVALALSPPPLLSTASTRLGLVLLALIWLSTALVQSPTHRRLASGFDPTWHGRLVATNWGRTLLWVMRGMLVGWWLIQAGETQRGLSLPASLSRSASFDDKRHDDAYAPVRAMLSPASSPDSQVAPEPGAT